MAGLASQAHEVCACSHYTIEPDECVFAKSVLGIFGTFSLKSGALFPWPWIQVGRGGLSLTRENMAEVRFIKANDKNPGF